MSEVDPGRSRSRWQRLHPAVRFTALAVVALVGANLLLSALDTSTRGSGPSSLGSSSSTSTGRLGLAAWVDLLRENGRAVRASDHLDQRSLRARDTVVIPGRAALAPSQVRALGRFVRAGGRLVVMGSSAISPLRRAVGLSLDWSPAGTTTARGVGTAPEVAGVTRVRAVGTGTWIRSPDASTILAGQDRVLAVATPVGAGRVIALADASPLENQLLDRADNAALALTIVGDGAVRFVDAPPASSSASGLDAVPERWKVALVGLVIASLVGMVAAGRRVGPPEARARELPPSRRLYVDAVAGALARAGQPAASLEDAQRLARATIARRAGVAPDANEATLRAAGARFGWDGEELAALFSQPTSRDDVLATGRAVAHAFGDDEP